jgi:hypothetical protein
LHGLKSGALRDNGCCGLQRIFQESLRAWFQVLDRYTLADALKGSRRLLQKLGIEQGDSTRLS